MLNTELIYIVVLATSCNGESNAEEYCNQCGVVSGVRYKIKAVKMYWNGLAGKFNAIQMQCNKTANVVVRVPLLCRVPMQ